MEYEKEINGKQVTFKRHLSAREAWSITKSANRAPDTTPTFDETVEQMRIFIESWEFEGDPADPKSYDGLDFFDFVQLSQAIAEYMQERMGGTNQGNSPSAST